MAFVLLLWLNNLEISHEWGKDWEINHEWGKDWIVITTNGSKLQTIYHVGD